MHRDVGIRHVQSIAACTCKNTVMLMHVTGRPSYGELPPGQAHSPRREPLQRKESDGASDVSSTTRSLVGNLQQPRARPGFLKALARVSSNPGDAISPDRCAITCTISFIRLSLAQWQKRLYA